MKKKIGLLVVSIVTCLSLSITAYAQPIETEGMEVVESDNYMTIVRTSGKVEVYPLDEVLEMNTISTNEVTVVEDVLTRQNASIYSAGGNSLVQPLASSYTFNWTIKGGYIGYSNRSFNLQKGDWVSFTVAIESGYSIEIGLYDNDEKEFISAGYWGSTDGWNIGDSFGTTKDLDNVSFAINNLREESQTFVGSYTLP
ncbi:MAG: hypothetical protein UFG06_04035 [Lachnospiraceae bacterium]|nr:hypothetical protein [Lachnospiraceae bacterium]